VSAKEIVAGRKPVIEALAGRRRVYRVFLGEGLKPSKTVDTLLAAAERAGVPLVTVGKDELDRLAGPILHQSAVALVSAYEYAGLAKLIELTGTKDTALVVALDGVTDPQNLGAVIRTAVAAGADGIVVPKHRAAPVTPTVVKAAAGATEHAIMVQANLNTAISGLKAAGFWVIGADAGASEEIWRRDLTGKVALVFGDEGQGLSHLVRSNCDFLAKLPLVGPIDSLNVSAAAAVMIYEVLRQNERRLTDS
jgi:23S rRNA (guanosine2251-2'-O)-methyltransferase